MTTPGFSVIDDALRPESPAISVIRIDPAVVDEFITRYFHERRHSPMSKSFALRAVRGQRCPTKMELLDHWAAALQFPDYFGRNWDAFDDMLGDLGWMPAAGYAIFVTSAHRLLEDAPNDLPVLLDIVRTAAGKHFHPDPALRRPPRRLKVVFQIEVGLLLPDGSPLSNINP